MTPALLFQTALVLAANGADEIAGAAGKIGVGAGAVGTAGEAERTAVGQACLPSAWALK